MVRSNFPVFIQPSREVGARLGDRIASVGLLAIREILKNRRGIEVAHQQIVYCGHHLALSSRITANGDLVINIDEGDPRLKNRLVLDADLAAAERRARDEDAKARAAARKLRRNARCW